MIINILRTKHQHLQGKMKNQTLKVGIASLGLYMSKIW
jgi:hypothetical protein